MENKDKKTEEKSYSNIPFIEGKTVDLCPLNSKHAELYAKWKNDPLVRRYSRNVLPRTLDEQKKRFEPNQQRFREFVNFEIWHKEDKMPLGRIGLGHIDWVNGWANAFIWIGEKDYWGKNIATEATELLLEYAFNELNLNKIHGGVVIKNTGSWSVAEKLGFTLEGIEREAMYVDGNYLDNKIYCIFKDEWLKRKKVR